MLERGVAGCITSGRRVSLLCQLSLNRDPALVELLELLLTIGDGRCQQVELARVELDLLLPTPHLELVRMRGISHRGRFPVGLGQLDLQSLMRALKSRQSRDRTLFVVLGGFGVAPRRRNGLGQLRVSMGELYLFPSSKLLA